jgi:hypothetical protein
MPSFTDLTTAEIFLMGLNLLGACFAFAVTLRARRRLYARMGMADAVRLLGWVILAGMLSACSAQKKGGGGQVEKPQSSTVPTKGGSAGGGRKTTVELTATPLDRYIREVREQVEKKWSIYLHVRRREGLAAGYLQLVFYVNKKGKVESLEVVNDKESNPLLTGITLRAIKDADIPRMPVDVLPLLPKNDPERLKIQYDALIC